LLFLREDIVKDGFEILILLPLPSRCWGCSYAPPHLILLFGKVTSLLILKGKTQAFDEMHIQEVADITHQQYQCHADSPTMCSSLNTRWSRPIAPPNKVHANGLASQVVKSSTFGKPGFHGLQWPTDTRMAMADQKECRSGSSWENLCDPVILDVLHQTFSKCGIVLGIIIFTKTNQFQVLLYYAHRLSI
jgi:polypyrimidine tract-binding protein 3